MEISLSPLQTSDGLLVSAAVRDVSERKSAEERINELAVLVESSQDAILAKTLDGIITYWNAAAHRLYGYAAEDAIGNSIAMLAPADCKDEIASLLERLGRGERVEHFEMFRVTQSGRLLDVDITLWPIKGRDGAIVGSCSIVRDIADRKRAEEELTELYRQQRHIALTLQHSLMGSPPALPEMQVASRYFPATQGAGVGGDWFDIIPLGGGQVGVLIGDVMGRGLDAAAVMGQLRSAARALAKTGITPRQLMKALDAFVADLPDQLVTCCYLVVDPDAGEVTICSAGHLPVLLVQPDTSVEHLPAPVCVPLGVGGIPYQQACIPVMAGSTLVLYTDGLVETPRSDIDVQLKLLAVELQSAFLSGVCLEEVSDRVLAALRPDADGHADDVTLLLARIPAAPLAAASMKVPADPASVSAGRRFVMTTLRSWGCEEATESACLLASEVLTNAISHSHPRGTLDLRLHHTAREMTVEVTDSSTHIPQLRHAESGDESGRGLLLVDTLATDWGTRPTDDGKTVWFTLPLKQPEPLG